MEWILVRRERKGNEKDSKISLQSRPVHSVLVWHNHFYSISRVEFRSRFLAEFLSILHQSAFTPQFIVPYTQYAMSMQFYLVDHT